MAIYIWHTGHPINEKLSLALHAGIPQSILRHTQYSYNYFENNNKYPAVAYGILRGTAEVFRHNRQNNIDFYEVDRGYINPNHYDGYYRISKNDLQAKYKDIDLPNDRLSVLKIDRAEWYHPKGQILICPPSDYIEAYYNLPHGVWAREIEDIFKNGKRRVKIRTKSDPIPLNNDLEDSCCVITFNSNVAVDASIKGIPVISGANTITSRWSNNNLQDLVNDKINVPDEKQIEKLLRFISYQQFTLEEIRSGKAWRIINSI